MTDGWDFENMRPYEGEEVQEGLNRLTQEPLLYKLMKWLYPEFNKEDIKEMFGEITSVDEFQENISGPILKVITQKTTTGLTFSNMDRMKKGVPYLFLSNHRDIVLDSALLNLSLMEKGYDTTQIAIGNNLVETGFMHDIARLNKNFIVHRDANPKEMLSLSIRLSNYIRNLIVAKNNSVWIAHKEGRSKDGDDRTANGLLKMLTMSSKLGVEDSLRELNIMPMVVSYEYDPCDLYKANELMSIKSTGSYEKKPGEDYNSMLHGIVGHKGGVNIAVGNALDKELIEAESVKNKNEKIKTIALAIDREMHGLYKLWPNNYIAYDWLTRSKEFKEYYTPIQRITFRNYIRSRTLKLLMGRKKSGHQREGFIKQARETLLQMYANPVMNKIESKNFTSSVPQS